MDIGERIKQRRIEMGFSVDEVAAKIGKARATVYRYENTDIKKMPADILIPLAKALNTTPAYLLGFSEDPAFTASLDGIANVIPMPETKHVPLVGTIACGTPILAEENITEYLAVDKKIPADFALQCKGDSMINDRIFDGDIVYIRSQPDVENGEIAAVRINGEATLKRVYKSPNKLVLSASNPTFADIVYTDEQLIDIAIIGKAVAFTSVIK